MWHFLELNLIYQISAHLSKEDISFKIFCRNHPEI